MKLYTNPASPFARKCRIIAHELNLKLEEIVVANARDDESIRRINPLKKIPILILDDGSALFDSAVICEYLNNIGGGKFFPGMTIWRSVSGRWKRWGFRRWRTASWMPRWAAATSGWCRRSARTRTISPATWRP
ncbi:MAG: glutathione S-transferase N-terminal domain-containing protein [Rhizomicrobium sp.]